VPAVRASRAIESGLGFSEASDWPKVKDLYLTAYGDEKLADQAVTQFVQRIVKERCDG